MTQTYTWRADGLGIEPLADGMCALVNNSTGTIEVREILLSRVSATVGASIGGAASGLWTTYRISATSGGTTVTPDKHDTSSSSLPSQVTMTANPDSVTTTALMRNMRDAYNSPTGGASLFGGLASNQTTFGYGAPALRQRTSAHWGHTYDGTIEGLTLREGQGYAETMDEQVAYPRTMWVHVVFSVVATGATFSAYMNYNVAPPGCPGKALWSLFNASGSGVVLRILSVDHFETGSTSGVEVPAVRLVRLGQIAAESPNLHAAPASELIAHDTTNTLPASVLLWKGPFRVYALGANNGGSVNWYANPISATDIAVQQLAGVMRCLVGMPPPNTATTAGPNLTDRLSLYSARRGSAGILLQPGDGLAICEGRQGTNYWSAFTLWNAHWMFTYTNASTGVSKSRVMGGL